MAKINEFVADLIERLEPVGPASSRAMFGGHGIYLQGAIIGIVVNELAYFKVDDQNRARYETAGSQPFSYSSPRQEQAISMSYWQVPEEVLERPGELQLWAKEAHAASLRSKEKKPARKRSTKRGKD